VSLGHPEAGTDVEADVTLLLDCLGRPCPVPVIELARALPTVEVGQAVTVLSDDPAAGPDLAAWCRMRGQAFEGGTGSSWTVRRLV